MSPCSDHNPKNSPNSSILVHLPMKHGQNRIKKSRFCEIFGPLSEQPTKFQYSRPEISREWTFCGDIPTLDRKFAAYVMSGQQRFAMWFNVPVIDITVSLAFCERLKTSFWKSETTISKLKLYFSLHLCVLYSDKLDLCSAAFEASMFVLRPSSLYLFASASLARLCDVISVAMYLSC